MYAAIGATLAKSFLVSPADVMSTTPGTVIDIETPRWLNLSNYVRDPDSDDGEEAEQDIPSLSMTMTGLLAHPRNGLDMEARLRASFQAVNGCHQS